MLLQRSTLSESHARPSAQRASEQGVEDSNKALTCIFYFFASQMRKNIEDADLDLVRRRKIPDQPTHKFENILARIGMHASFSPLISQFDTYPVDIPDAPGFPKRSPKPSRDTVHDTVLLMKFKSKRAREEWIATKEWQAFMRNTENQEVFRRMPHVRCASSTKGLMDPIDILTS